MPGRERLETIGARRGADLCRQIAAEARNARLGLGLTQTTLARALGVSRARISRWELGRSPPPSVFDTARWLRILGLDLSLRTYPAATALRDVAHATLIGRFMRQLGGRVPYELEAAIRQAGDRRAWDMRMRTDTEVVGVAAETRLRDWQALLRRERAKCRDDRVDRLLLVLADTHANRDAVRSAGVTFRAELPLDGRSIWPALRGGRRLLADGYLFV